MIVPDFEKMSLHELLAYLTNCVGGPLMSEVVSRVNAVLSEASRRGPLQLNVGNPQEELAIYGSEAAMAKVRELGVEINRVGNMLNAAKAELERKDQKIKALEEAYKTDIVAKQHDGEAIKVIEKGAHDEQM